jgi:hypothetical protein
MNWNQKLKAMIAIKLIGASGKTLGSLWSSLVNLCVILPLKGVALLALAITKIFLFTYWLIFKGIFDLIKFLVQKRKPQAEPEVPPEPKEEQEQNPFPIERL